MFLCPQFLCELPYLFLTRSSTFENNVLESFRDTAVSTNCPVLTLGDILPEFPYTVCPMHGFTQECADLPGYIFVTQGFPNGRRRRCVYILCFEFILYRAHIFICGLVGLVL